MSFLRPPGSSALALSALALPATAVSVLVSVTLWTLVEARSGLPSSRADDGAFPSSALDS